MSQLGSGDPSCKDVAVMVDTPIENSPVTKSPVLSGLMDQVRTSSPDKGCVSESFFISHLFHICTKFQPKVPTQLMDINPLYLGNP